MKTSEIILKLQEMVRNNGDLEFKVYQSFHKDSTKEGTFEIKRCDLDDAHRYIAIETN
jgi:hypothetical protein